MHNRRLSTAGMLAVAALAFFAVRAGDGPRVPAVDADTQRGLAVFRIEAGGGLRVLAASFMRPDGSRTFLEYCPEARKLTSVYYGQFDLTGKRLSGPGPLRLEDFTPTAARPPTLRYTAPRSNTRCDFGAEGNVKATQ